MQNTSIVNLLTFQSQEVLDILLKEGVYLADNSKSREKRNYIKDVEQLGGYQPIWCFSPIGIKSRFNPLKEDNKFSQEDFINGSLFDRFKCEMSLPSGEAMNDLVVLEVEVEESCIRRGLTHNAYIGAVVIPKLELNNLVAVYKLSYDDNDDLKWFYPELKVIKVFKESSIFKEDFICKKVKRKKG